MYAKPLHPICFTYRSMHIYPWQMDPTSDQRSIHCYIKEVSHMTECTCTHNRLTPLPIDHRSMLHHYTCPLPIDHTSVQHHYTPCKTVIGIKSVLKFTKTGTIITSLLQSSLLQESPSSLLPESFSSVKLSQFLQYLSKYALLSSSCFTTLNKEVWTWKDYWPPWRTSTYERPFTWEGNYLVELCLPGQLPFKTFF